MSAILLAAFPQPLVSEMSCPVPLFTETQAPAHLGTPASPTPGSLAQFCTAFGDLGIQSHCPFRQRTSSLLPTPESQPSHPPQFLEGAPTPHSTSQSHLSLEATPGPGDILGLPVPAANGLDVRGGRPEAGGVRGKEGEEKAGQGAWLLGCRPDQQARARPLAGG